MFVKFFGYYTIVTLKHAKGAVLKVNILHYVDAESISWVVPYIEHIKSIGKLGVNQSVLCRPGGEIERTARENDIPVFTWKPLISGVPVSSPGFVKLIREINPDIIHTRLSSAAGIAGFWSKYHRVPIVSTFDKPAKAKYYVNSSWYISCAEWLKSYMVKSQGMDAHKITVIHNPADTSKFSRDDRKRIEFRKFLGLNDNDILFSGMGIYVRRKGFDVLIKAFAKVCSSYRGGKNLRLALIGGDGENGMRENYLRLAGELGVNIILPEGFVHDVREWLWASDIFVMPSREEGFSIALLEGLASGLPAVVSDIEPFTEIISAERNNGLVAKKDDPESFAAMMMNMLAMSHEERQKIIANSFGVLKEFFTPEAAASKTLEVYSRFTH